MEYPIPTSLVRQRYSEGKYQETGLKDTEDFDAWLSATKTEESVDAIHKIIEYCENQLPKHAEYAYSSYCDESTWHAGWYRAYDDVIKQCRGLLRQENE